MGFSDDDVASLLGCVDELHAAHAEPQAARAIARCVARAIDCDLALHVTLDSRRGAAVISHWPRELRLPPIDADLVALHRREHPLVVHLLGDRAIRAWRPRHVARGADFEASPLHRELYAALPARRQLAMRLASPDGHLHGVALLRSSAEFSERSAARSSCCGRISCRRCASLIERVASGRPVRRRSSGRARTALVLLGSDLAVRLCSEQARLWLAEYFPHARSRYRLTLPPLVADWARRASSSKASASATRCRCATRSSCSAASATSRST